MTASLLYVLCFFERNELDDENACKGDKTEKWNGNEAEVIHPANEAVVRAESISVRNTFQGDMIKTDTPAGTSHDSDEQSIHVTGSQHDRQVVNSKWIHKDALEPTQLAW